MLAVKHFLSRIESKKHLNAFNRVYADEALARAQWLDNEFQSRGVTGKLHGVVVGIKDVICYKDHRVTASSKVLENFVSVYSATVVEKMLNEGAIIIGHLNCDEFAMGSTNEHSYFGKVLNPLDETLVPGGSSGGSAAAQAAGLCMITLGSDTGGSVRQPADFCAVIGFKPGYGRISRYGLIAYASSFDHIGIFANNVPDVSQVLEVISGPDDHDATASTEPMAEPLVREQFRFAYFPAALDHSSLDPGIRSSIYETLQALKKRGHQVKEVEFELLDHLVPAYYILTTAEASTNLARYDGVRYGYRSPEIVSELDPFYRANRSQAFGVEVQRRILLGSFVLSAGYYDAYYTQAQKVRRMVKEKLKNIFNDHDVIILPNSPVPAYPLGDKIKDPIAMYLADLYTVMANLAGIPAISLPIYRNSGGQSFGIQAMSAPQNEVILLQISNELMKMKNE